MESVFPQLSATYLVFVSIPVCLVNWGRESETGESAKPLALVGESQLEKKLVLDGRLSKCFQEPLEIENASQGHSIE